MDKKELVCIECPRGCTITVTAENGIVSDIQGAFCARGKTYAGNEIVRPLRFLTTTIRLGSGEMLPVKTDKPIDKSKIFEVMKVINKIKVQKPVKIGQIIKSNIDDEGTNLIAIKNFLKH